jgi:2-hydroxychromene-2-carboxylate isomerase
VPTVDYWLSVASPWAYLGSDRFVAMASRHGAKVNVRPMELGDVFAATGGVPFAQRSAARQSYRQLELARWSRRLGIPINLSPRYYPVDRAPASRLLLAAREAGHDALSLSNVILKAVWADDRDISNWLTLQAIADAIGLPGAALVQHARQCPIADQLAIETRAAVDAGVFGAPTYVLETERFWGQDRLEFLEEALSSITDAQLHSPSS